MSPCTLGWLRGCVVMTVSPPPGRSLVVSLDYGDETAGGDDQREAGDRGRDEECRDACGQPCGPGREPRLRGWREQALDAGYGGGTAGGQRGAAAARTGEGDQCGGEVGRAVPAGGVVIGGHLGEHRQLG